MRRHRRTDGQLKGVRLVDESYQGQPGSLKMLTRSHCRGDWHDHPKVCAHHLLQQCRGPHHDLIRQLHALLRSTSRHGRMPLPQLTSHSSPAVCASFTLALAFALSGTA